MKSALKDSFLAEQSDDELVELARRTGNDDGAFEELYRRHENGARTVARHIVRSRHDADDVVNEAFAGVIAAINHGAGPRSNFRQYLMACVRNSCKSRRWCGRSITTDPSLLERSGPIFEDPERLSEAGLVASAFSSLSPDWQQTLWMTVVEERPTAEVAEQLGRRPAAVAALAHRAREAFAEAYLAQHQARATDPACARISPKLAHYVRGRSGDVDNIIVERHLIECVTCSCAVDEMRDLNSSLRTLTGPAPLVGMGVAGAGAATLVGILPLATAGGWSVGAVSGAAVAKIAVLGALLVPAAIVAANTATSSPTTPQSISTGRSSGTPRGHDSTPPAGGAASTVASTLAPLLGDVVSLMPAGPGAIPIRVTVPNEVPVGGRATVEAASSIVGTVNPDIPHVALPVAGPLPAVGGSVSSSLPKPPAAKVDVGASPAGVGVTIGATIPVLGIPINLNINLPAISTPPVQLPELTIPTISTPPITTPPLLIPSLTLPLPNLGLPIPPITTPAISVPSITLLPSISTPPIVLPLVSVPSVTLPVISLPQITIPKILSGS